MLQKQKVNFASQDLLLLKNSIKNETIIDLDNFSENDYLELILKSFVSQQKINLIINQIDANTQLGSCSKILQKLRFYKGVLDVFCINYKLPPFYKQKNMSSIEEVCQVI